MPFSPRGFEQSLVLPPRWPLILYTGTLYLSADEVCTWPVAPLGEAKWLWRFSWYRNNRQQRCVSSGKRRYTNADIIIIIILSQSLLTCSWSLKPVVAKPKFKNPDISLSFISEQMAY